MTFITQSSWQQVVGELRKSNPAAMRAWLLELEPPTLAHGMLTIRARNDAQVRHLERARSAVAGAAQAVLGRLVTVDAQLDAEDRISVADVVRREDSNELRPDFRLDRFLVGPENRLAHAAICRMVQDRECPYSPLFLHGSLGSGKSHLLQAICRAMNESHGGEASRYATARQFIAGFTESFETAAPGVFRRQFAEADLFALDDVEFFAGKARSQEEFFHVLNGLLARGARVVLSADRHPGAISGLEPRLVSRLIAGLVVAIDPPALETRLSILKIKNQADCFEFPDPVLQRIAERCPVEDLDRILPRLNALSEAQGGGATMDLLEGLLPRASAKHSLDGAKGAIDNGRFP